jgi:hypothetical protein
MLSLVRWCSSGNDGAGPNYVGAAVIVFNCRQFESFFVVQSCYKLYMSYASVPHRTIFQLFELNMYFQ